MTELAGITLYDVDDMSKFLGLSIYSINKLCRERRIKATKVGSGWKVTKEALENYLNIPKIRR